MFDEPIVFEELEGENMQSYEKQVLDFFEQQNFSGRLIKNIHEFRYNDSDEFVFEALTNNEIFMVDVFVKTKGSEKNITQIVSDPEFDSNYSEPSQRKLDTIRAAYRAFCIRMESLIDGSGSEQELFLDFD